MGAAEKLVDKRTKLLFEKDKKYIERFELIEESVRNILTAIGEDLSREGLVGTPFRVAKMMLNETMSGYGVDLAALADAASFEECKTGNIVLVKNISFYSNCEHHMVPFFGKAHVAYLPNGKVLGLSKIPRVVKAASKKLQLQENLGQEIANAIQKASNAQAVCVILESEKHLCVAMRGIEDTTSSTITIATAAPEGKWGVNIDEFTSTVFKMLGIQK